MPMGMNVHGDTCMRIVFELWLCGVTAKESGGASIGIRCLQWLVLRLQCGDSNLSNLGIVISRRPLSAVLSIEQAKPADIRNHKSQNKILPSLCIFPCPTPFLRTLLTDREE